MFCEIESNFKSVQFFLIYPVVVPSSDFCLYCIFKDVAEFNWDTKLQGSVFVFCTFFVVMFRS